MLQTKQFILTAVCCVMTTPGSGCAIEAMGGAQTEAGVAQDSTCFRYEVPAPPPPRQASFVLHAAVKICSDRGLWRQSLYRSLAPTSLRLEHTIRSLLLLFHGSSRPLEKSVHLLPMMTAAEHLHRLSSVMGHPLTASASVAVGHVHGPHVRLHKVLALQLARRCTVTCQGSTQGTCGAAPSPQLERVCLTRPDTADPLPTAPTKAVGHTSGKAGVCK